jgi:hypothetical protein
MNEEVETLKRALSGLTYGKVEALFQAFNLDKHATAEDLYAAMQDYVAKADQAAVESE